MRSEWWFIAFVTTCLIPRGPSVLRAQDQPKEQTESQKQEDDTKLGERLIKKAVKGGDEDVMDQISDSMTDAAQRLQVDLDAGNETQAVQRNVLDQLDKAIKQAAKQRRPRPQSQQSASSDKRQAPKSTKEKEKTGAKPQRSTADSSTSHATKQPDQTPTQKDPVTGALKEGRRSWGNLPDRERDEIIQGTTEGFVEKYRTWIERYYRALQENDN